MWMNFQTGGKQNTRSVAVCCRVGPGAVIAEKFFQSRCLSCKYIYHFIKACATTKWAMLNSHHIVYLNVGRVCVRVCVTEAGRDLFMHNKSIWLIIEDVWNLFEMRDWIASRNTVFTCFITVFPSVLFAFFWQRWWGNSHAGWHMHAVIRSSVM